MPSKPRRSFRPLGPALALGLLLAGTGSAVSSLTQATSPTLELTSAPRTATDAAARRVMPLGDSITDGYNIPGGYRIPLLPALNAAGLRVDLVGSARNGPASLADRDHEGHSGWRIDQLLAEVDGWLSSAQPDVILLMIGTNDMIQNRDVATAPARLGTLLDRIAARRPAATILVASLPPLSDPAGNARVRAFNAALPGVVRARAALGRWVRLVDASARLTPADLADGVHPNEGGYRKLAEMWLGALRGL
ncbi:SGNH/GDSL hydrolase family protein [Deinococcus sp. YIM 134068]|uniref:SGNH/GDSL hydrolase family protein n=1 Tax=Deinococcus lichenicola TaxID=3118910 RepID=UPI002F93CA63